MEIQNQHFSIKKCIFNLFEAFQQTIFNKLYTIIDVILFRNFLCYSKFNNPNSKNLPKMSFKQHTIILNEYSKFWTKSQPL